MCQNQVLLTLFRKKGALKESLFNAWSSKTKLFFFFNYTADGMKKKVPIWNQKSWPV